jgi:hypothetical protein
MSESSLSLSSAVAAPTTLDIAELDKVKALGPKFRLFRDEVLTSLREFERVKEWPDLIQALQRLIRSLERHTQYATIPHKLLFSKRLNQCMNASLPSGVHFKALELLTLVLERIATSGLASELHLWCPAFFALFQHCATNVKPGILTIYERQLMPLRRQLTPCLSGLVLGLLPGLDDAGGEFYRPVLALLDQVCAVTSVRAFFFAVWKALLIGPHVRVSAVNLLHERLPRQRSVAQLAPYLPMFDTLVLTALGKALADLNGLVQRQTLELLNTHFPLDCPLLASVAARTQLVGLALPVLQQREVSLTRRLMAWLLGSGSAGYFVRFGRQPVIDAVRSAFAVEPLRVAPADNAKQLVEVSCRPLRILMFLLDTPDVGDAIIDELMVDALLYLNRHKDGFSFSHDVMRTMNLLIDQLQPQMLWDFTCSLFAPTATDASAAERARGAVPLVDALLDILPSEALFAPATQATSLPTLMCCVVRALHALVDDAEPLAAALALTLKVVGKLYSLRQQHHALPPAPSADVASFEDAAAAAAEASVRMANVRAQREQLLTAIADFHAFSVRLIETHPMLQPGTPFVSSPLLRAFDMTCQLLSALETALPIARASSPMSSSSSSSSSSAPQSPPWFLALTRVARYDEPQLACIAARTVISLLQGSDDTTIDSYSLPASVRRAAIGDAHLLPGVVQRLWRLLEPAFVQVHYTAAESLMRLSTLACDYVTPVVASALTSRDGHEREVAHERFALLWRLSGELGGDERFSAANLFVMLDSLSDEQPSVRLTGQSWLADSIARVERVLDPLLMTLLAPDTKRARSVYCGEFDTARVLHTFRKLKVIIECDFQLFMRQVLSKSVNADVAHAVALLERGADDDADDNGGDDDDNDGGRGASAPGSSIAEYGRSYLDLLASTAMLFVQGRTADEHSAQFRERNGIVRTVAAEFLQFLLTKITLPERARVVARNVRTGVLSTLAEAVAERSLVLQVYLLGVLRAVVVLSGGARTADREGSVMLMQTLLSGLLQPAAKNIRYHWLEFITASLPYMGDALPDVVPPVLRCMCDLLDSFHSAYDSLSSRDILMLLHALAVILDHCLFDAGAATPATATSAAVAPVPSTLAHPVRVLGKFVKDVFGGAGIGVAGGAASATAADASSHSGALLRAKASVAAELGVVLHSLVAVWQKGAAANGVDAVVLTPDEVHNKYAIQDQIVGILDPLAGRFAVDLVARLLDRWQVSPTALADRQDPPDVVTTLELLNQLSSRAQVLGAALALTKQSAMREIRDSQSSLDDAAAAAAVAVADGGSAHNSFENVANDAAASPAPAPGAAAPADVDAIDPALHEPLTRQLASTDFLSCLIQRCVSLDTLCDAWPALLDAIKVTLAHAHVCVYPFLLRVLHFYVRRVSLERFGDLRSRIRRDLQQVFQRVVERCFLLAGRETAPTALAGERDRRRALPSHSSSPRVSLPAAAAARRRERRGSTIVAAMASASGGRGMRSADATHQLRRFARDEALDALAEMLAPTLDNVFDDNKDRGVALLASSIVRIVPHIRGTAARRGAAESPATASACLLASLTDFGFMLRAYRNEALDAFYQSDFFRMSPEALLRWTRVIDHVMARDSSALAEFMKLAARSLTTSQPMGGATLLTSAAARSRELDVSRARFVKRLAFILFAGVQDQCVHILPQIQERLVEALRVASSPRLHNEVFLCFRCMLLRFSAPKLASFWPVILTELVRVFSLETPDPNLLLASAKFLDLALVLPSDSFSHFEWVFVADRIDSGLAAIVGGEAGGADEADAALNFARDKDEAPFAPLLSQVCAGAAVAEGASFAAYCSEASVDGLQRPIITARSLSEFAGDGGFGALVSFLERFHSIVSINRVAGRAIDYAFIDAMLRSDFAGV